MSWHVLVSNLSSATRHVANASLILLWCLCVCMFDVFYLFTPKLNDNGGSNFWICGWNPMVGPFKWNLSPCFSAFVTLAPSGSEMVKLTPKCYLNYLTCIQKWFSAIIGLVDYKVPSHGHILIRFNGIYTISCVYQQGPVVRTLVSANLGLNFNLGFFFLPKAFSRKIFFILFRVSNHQIVSKVN